MIGSPEVFERHYRANLSAFYDPLSTHRVRIGTGVYFGDVHTVKDHRNFGPDPLTGLPLPPGSPVIDVSDTSSTFLPEKTRRNYYLFAQDIWQTGFGWELEGLWKPFTTLALNANLAFQNAENERTGRTVENAPRRQLYVRADWQWYANWHISGQLNWVMGRRRVVEDDRPAIDDYRIVDLAAHYKSQASPIEFSLSVRNLFDSDAREPTVWLSPGGQIPNDLPLPSRHFLGDIRYRF